MTTDKKILFEEYDDWVKVYIDGKLTYENHSVSYNKVLNLLDIPFEKIYIEDEED